MATLRPMRERIKTLKETYDTLRAGKGALLGMIDEAEIAESVYNSNAIENSTLTLKETEKILLELEVSRDVSVREVFEAKNLARVAEYVRGKAQNTELTKEMVLLLHKMLLVGINDRIAGRFRGPGEYVRVGTHIGAPPEHVERLADEAFTTYTSDFDRYFIDKIALFHLDVETIHPFMDGNGRIGRLLINYQLNRLGFPNVIIRDKEKQRYYEAFGAYRDAKNTKPMEWVLALALTESLHKRIAYLRGETIVALTDYAKTHGQSVHALLNAARRQTVPAFREKGVWKIGNQHEGSR